MMPCAVLVLLLASSIPGHAGETESFPGLDLNNPASVQEATRVLEEEVKLAARPQTYLLLDLVTRTLQIKGRGVELHRITITAWSAKALHELKGTHRLITRPPVLRRKIDPTASVEQKPISLADMPVEYTLSFTPPLSIDVVPIMGESPFLWIRARGQTWWRDLKDSWSADQPATQSPHLHLEFSAEQAQSLAWSVVDGMALVIRRPSDKR
jgi:hypothetical protein